MLLHHRVAGRPARQAALPARVAGLACCGCRARSRRSRGCGRARRRAPRPRTRRSLPTSRISFSPLMNAARAIVAALLHRAGGDGLRRAGAVQLDLIVSWKIAPRPAMPVAIPTWRNVLLMPDAMPARRGSTTLTAIEASGGLTIPMPMPPTMKPGSRSSSSSRRDAVHEQQRERRRAPARRRAAPAPGARRQPPGDRRDQERDQRSGRNRRPAWIGE